MPVPVSPSMSTGGDAVPSRRSATRIRCNLASNSASADPNNNSPASPRRCSATRADCLARRAFSSTSGNSAKSNGLTVMLTCI